MSCYPDSLARLPFTFMKRALVDKFRAAPWLFVTLVMTTVIGILYPQQVGLLLWSLCKVTAGAYVGYWIDRSIFYYARPGDFLLEASWLIPAAMMLRRALIMSATILALGLGV